MMPSVLKRRLVATALAGLACSASLAVSLGALQGAATFGQPLEISVPVALQGDSQALRCTEAAVFYGSWRVDPGRVATEAVPVGAGAGMVRIRSTQAVNDPLVTVDLHLGCGDPVARRYVVRVEQPAAQPRVEIVPAPLTAPAPPATPAAAGADTAAATAPPAPPPAAPARPPVRAAAVPPQPRPVLRLEPAQPLPEGHPVLRMSAMLAPLVEASAEQRARAAALWRAINAQPEDMLRQAQREQALHKELQGLRQARSPDTALADLREQLRQARQERYANPLVYLLLALALALACATVAALAGRRSGKPAAAGPRWWQRDRGSAQTDFGTTTLPPRAARRTPVPVLHEREPEDSVFEGTGVDINLIDVDPGDGRAPQGRKTR